MPWPRTASASSPTRSRSEYQPGRCGFRTFGGPQAPSVGVLGHQDHVAGPGGGEGRRPPVGVPLIEAGDEVGGERPVGPISPHLAVVPRHRAVGEPQRVLVPLDVGRVGECVGSTGGQQFAVVAGGRGERRDGGRRPVDEDPELGVAPPGRYLPRPETAERRSGRGHAVDCRRRRRGGADGQPDRAPLVSIQSSKGSARSLPRSLAVYIARSALDISSSTVIPRSGEGEADADRSRQVVPPDDERGTTGGEDPVGQ